MSNTTSLSDAVAGGYLRPADLLLFRGGRRLSSLLIARAGRGPYVHAAMAGWRDGRIYVLEMLQWVGARAVLLEDQVRAYPGRWDVFTAGRAGRYDFNRHGAVLAMWDLIDRGVGYGYLNVLWASLLHMPGIRLFIRPETDDRAIDRRPPFCSHAVAHAYRTGGGVDPVPNLADRLVEPNDLSRSRFFKKSFTLVP